MYLIERPFLYLIAGYYVFYTVFFYFLDFLLHFLFSEFFGLLEFSMIIWAWDRRLFFSKKPKGSKIPGIEIFSWGGICQEKATSALIQVINFTLVLDFARSIAE